MTLIIASTFTDSLSRLNDAEAARVKQAAFDFQLSPAAPHLAFRPIWAAADRGLMRFDVDEGLVVLVHAAGERFTLCRVGPTAQVLGWARRHRFEEHPTTGALQIVDVPPPADPPPVRLGAGEAAAFAEMTIDELLACGVPADHVAWVQRASLPALLARAAELPEEVVERLSARATGREVGEGDGEGHGLEHPDAGRRLQRVEDPRTLEQAMAAPWERWIVFLHPSQRRVVEESWAGPVKLVGGPGTGKTVAALHRAAHLARAGEGEVLLTTFTRALAGRLSQLLDLLMGEGAPARRRVTVAHVHSVAVDLHRSLTGERFEALDRGRLMEAIAAHRRPGSPFSEAYLLAEWDAVVEPAGIDSWPAYRAARRRGRGRALGAKDKRQMWRVFEAVLKDLRREGVTSWAQLCHAVADRLAEGERPWRHVVADEAQDLGLPELRLLRHLAPQAEDDLFVCADAGQRIYARRAAFAAAGIEFGGRIERLTVNYRTTEQIRRFSEAVLPREEDGPSTGTSLSTGPEPTLALTATPLSEADALTDWIQALIVDGFSPASIAIFGRTRELVRQRGIEALQRLGLAWRWLNDDALADDAGVAVGTMHLAKGLEFRAVAVVGCDAHALPHPRALEDLADEADRQAALEQERHLLHVAASRARERLFVGAAGAPSAFLGEVVQGLETRVEPAEPEEAPAPAPEGPPDELHKTPFKISPSSVARYFGVDCERYLRFDSTWTAARHRADGVPAEAPIDNDLTRAVIEAGFAWERTVVEELLAGQVAVADGPGALTDRYFPWPQSVERLWEEPAGRYIYEPTLRAPESFYVRYGIDPDLVTFSDNRPDLIAVLPGEGGGRVFRLIDMKRGASMRTSYKVQLLLYALELDAIVKDAAFRDATVDVETAAVWHGGDPAPTPCDLSALRFHVERFLEHDLHRVLVELAPREVAWHVNYRCEWCRYFDHCRAQMEREDDLSRVTRLTSRGKAHLQRQGVDTVAALETRLQDGDADGDLLAGCASLAGQGYALTHKARALLHDEVHLLGTASPGLPRPTPREVTLIVTLQSEALARSVYLAGYLARGGPEVPPRVIDPRGRGEVRVLVAEAPGRTESLARQLIYELHALLMRLDAYNLGKGRKEKLGLQVYVYSARERALLVELLLDALEDPELAEPAMTLLLYFQGPELILTADHPERNVPYPVVVLLSVLGRLMALPVDVAYTLPESLQALGADVDYPRDADYHFPYGPALRAEPVYQAWHDGRLDRLPELRQRGRAHLEAIAALHGAIRDRASSQLYARAPAFHLPPATRLDDPLLSRLAFFARYESVIGCLQIRQQRTVARKAIPWSEDVVELEATDGKTFRVLSEDAEIGGDGFPDLLLAEDSHRGRLAQLQFPDYYYRKTSWRDWGGRSPHVAVVAVRDTEEDDLGFTASITLNYARPFARGGPAPGDRYLLQPRFTDYNTGRLVRVLEDLDGQPIGLFRKLLAHPGRLSPRPLPTKALHAAEALTADLGLTPSQRSAWEAICRVGVLALWGPPGTGKTHFVATAIAALLEAHRQTGRPCRVLVTSSNHAAIENVLRKTVARHRDLFGDAPLSVAKGGGWRGEEAAEGVTERKSRLDRWVAEHERGVLGATVWAVYKDLDQMGTFDLVVVDEASQVKVPEAAIPTSLVADGGPIVFAGDHLQLPPIVHGTYPDPEEGRPALHRSIFEAVRSVDGGYYERQLQENFRMNARLTRHAAELLYGPGYRCGAAPVAARRLPWRPTAPGADALVEACLDPDAPLVVVLFDGEAGGKDSPAEADVVTRLTLALRDGLEGPGGAPYATDAAFFTHGLFVVSPHHSQIRMIRRALAAERDWTAHPFVDTVDKMQGQEADAVIVSYGVSDPEFAQMEADFIYSRNRLNVSVTRARSKLILCLSRALLDASPRVLESEEAAEGLAYMRGLVERVAGYEGGRRFLMEGGVEVEVLRR